MTAATSEAFYLTSGEEAVYALFDPARTDDGGSGVPSAVSVLICPLFGNDDLCAYRARLEWARTLAAAGHATLRIDLPGTGDSAGGPASPGRLPSWVDAVATAAGWLRQRPRCERVCAIGIGLGALLAYCAASEGAAIDDLALWAAPARGRTFVRQLRVLSRMEASSATAEQPPGASLPEGALASAGFLLSAETVAALEALDLTKLALPEAPRRRVLLLERDGLDVDARLRETIERSGAELTVAPGPGYGAMVTPPQQSLSPTVIFETVNAWLADRPATAGTAFPGLTAAAGRTGENGVAPRLELPVGDARIRESPLTIAHGEGRLVGVLAEGVPAENDAPASLCAVLLNAGALRHIGPNRMWVEAARRWAACGVPTLRIDLAGIGDSDGDAGSLQRDEGLYVPRYVAQTIEVIDALSARGLPQRFVLAGLCSGAYWAFQAALEDDRVAAAFMINPRALFWDWDVGAVRDARNFSKVLHPTTWRKLLRGQITRERVATIARGVRVALTTLPTRARTRRAGRDGGVDRLSRALDRLEGAGTDLLGVFTADEPVFEELQRDGGLARMRARPNVRVESIPGPLTSHTLEPLALQSAVAALLDEALQRLLREDPQPGSASRRRLSARAG